MPSELDRHSRLWLRRELQSILGAGKTYDVAGVQRPTLNALAIDVRAVRGFVIDDADPPTATLVATADDAGVLGRDVWTIDDPSRGRAGSHLGLARVLPSLPEWKSAIASVRRP